MTDAKSQVQDLECHFAGNIGEFELDLEFRARAHGITALFGTSGSGKTTTLRCIAGLTRLSGRCAMGDTAWQDDNQRTFVATHQRRLGFVFQQSNLFNHLSVLGNLRYGARRAGLALDSEHERNVIELLDLDKLLTRSCRTLSGGERQRVAIGRALLTQPRVLLMDEPVSALDRHARDDVLNYLHLVRDTLAVPIIYVSHDISEVANLADHMVVLSAGRKVADGRLEEVLERLDLHPETGRFEAGVVLTTRVIDHNERFNLTNLDFHGQSISVPRIAAQTDEQIRVRIRARDVALATNEPSGISIRNVLRGSVVEIVEEASTAFAETLIDIGGGRLRARVTREALNQLGIAQGSAVYALVKSISFDRRSVGGGR